MVEFFKFCSVLSTDVQLFQELVVLWLLFQHFHNGSGHNVGQCDVVVEIYAVVKGCIY